MKKNIRIQIANPSGNITIFVLDRFDRCQYREIASELLSREDLKGEQVAFITGPDSMEMCGQEFCGNASRSFALMIAKERKSSNPNSEITVNVSGVAHPLTVNVNTDTNYTKIRMPSPISMQLLKHTPINELENSTLIDFDGIVHVVLTDISPNIEIFNKIKNYINERFNPPAMGVMFYCAATNILTPVVYVKDVDTTYFEGSCGSGSTATAITLSREMPDGTYSYNLMQPAGCITSTVIMENGHLEAVYIEGSVILSKEITVQLDLSDCIAFPNS